MASRFRDKWVSPWRQSVVDAIERGIKRGDFPESTDVVLTLDVIVGAVFQRTLVIPEPMTGGLDEAIVDLILPTLDQKNRMVADIGDEADSPGTTS